MIWHNVGHQYIQTNINTTIIIFTFLVRVMVFATISVINYVWLVSVIGSKLGSCHTVVFVFVCIYWCHDCCRMSVVITSAWRYVTLFEQHLCQQRRCVQTITVLGTILRITYKLWNVDAIRWSRWNIATNKREVDYWKSEDKHMIACGFM
jgi:hypothetical protein